MKTYGGPNFEQAAGIVATNDGGYFITGYSASFDSSGASIYLLKIDSRGNEVFSKAYGGSAYDIPTGLVATFDGGFAVCGMTWSGGAGDSDAFLLKIDSAGNFQWMKTLGSGTREKAFSFIQTIDSGFAITGYTKYDATSPEDDKRIFLIKTDNMGNMKWSKTYGGAVYDEASSIIQTYDKGLLIAGLTINDGAGNNDCYLIKTDSAGNIMWTKSIGTNANEGCNDIVQVADSGYFMVGSCEDCGYGEGDILLIRLSAMGAVLWGKCIGTNEVESSTKLALDKNGNLILMGLSVKASATDILLSRLNLRDSSLVTSVFGTSGNQQGTDLIASDNGSIVLSGQSSTEDDPTDDLLVLKLTDTEATCFTSPSNIEVKPVALLVTDSVQLFPKSYTEQLFNPTEFAVQTITTDFCLQNVVNRNIQNAQTIYPNPFQDYLKITTDQYSVKEIKLFDATGQLVICKRFQEKESLIDCRSLISSMYYYYLTDHEGVIRKGLIYKSED